MYHQEPPFAVQVELTEGCQLRCSFCGINGIRGKDRTYKFMTPKTAFTLGEKLRDASWHPRIELAVHGEPTMNPQAARIIAILRNFLPKSSFLMLSNGGGLLPDPATKIAALFDAGLNTLGLDEYEGITLVPKILEQLNGRFTVQTYPDDPSASPHTPQKPSARRLIHIRPISLNEKGTHATLNNHAGAGAPLNDNGAGKRCAKPFREMSVRWDGNVAVCCNDWRGVLKLGNTNTDTIDQIWNGPVAQAARRKLYRGERTFGPCKGCDATSYRAGLLPDKLGKAELARPSKKDEALLAEASARRPMAKVVKREWEL